MDWNENDNLKSKRSSEVSIFRFLHKVNSMLNMAVFWVLCRVIC